MEVNKKKFISGVVEGFYGKPWSKQQRLSLFERLGKLGLNTYVYAPKDDAKHRKNWRDEYMEIEKENLRALISGAESVGINFVYALSPGVDIVFSCPKDVNCLKRKIKQVADLGCTSFALLFDDIEPELSLPDKQDFDSFADAQVFITNQIYEHVGNPAMFLFCPTEYCTTRAKPSVEKSKYLQVLGKSLNENIGILWTGPKVVSKEISTHSIDAVSKVLKRKPVIWDNIHANDYDQRRVFLGPYDGRPADLYEHVSGILTNPNCEYECNFIAVHTLATWINKCEASRMNCDEKKMCIDEEMKLDCDRMDDKKESADELMDFAVDEETVSSTEVCVENATDIEVSGGSKDDLLENSAVRLQNLTSNVEAYCPKSALQTAVLAWLDEFKKIKEIPKTVAGFSSSPIKIAVSDDTNSLVGDTVQGGSKDEGNLGEKGELQSDEKDDIAVESDNEEVQCCPHHSPDKKQNSSPKKKAKRSHIDYSDLLLLADLFFLPYEHGEQAKRLISEFRWLKQHAPPPESANKKNKKTEEWEKRASVYHEHCEAVLDLFVHLSQAPNQQLVQEIYPYIWDVKEVVMILNAFVKWLGSKDKKCKKGSHCVPEDPEPWLFRGGIAEELERLLPIDGKSDMLSRKPPAVIAQEVYAIRPYLDADKGALYNLCIQVHDQKHEFQDLFSRFTELAGDKYVSVYLRHSRSLTFVVEGENGLCGYCVAASDTKAFYRNYKDWLSTISDKYERPTGDPESWSSEQELIESIYNPLCYLPKELYSKYPAHISINLLPHAKSANIGKRLLACLISVLKAEGIQSAYTEVSSSDPDVISFYADLGFSNVTLNKPCPKHISILGRDI